MKLRIVLTLVLFLAGTSSSLVFCATKLTIGHSTINPRIAPLWVGQEKGFFQKYGIDATVIFVRNTPIMIAGMKSGSVPIAYGGGDRKSTRLNSSHRL